MRLVVIADVDVRERMRCARGIASRSAVSAIGAASWAELEAVIEGAERATLVVVYAHPLPGAPDDALARLRERAHRVVVASDDGTPSGPGADGVEHTGWPVAEEKLALLAHATGRDGEAGGLCFAPVDLLQVLCPSGGAYTLIVEHEGADSGVIEVQAGCVWSAFDGLGVGEDAFARLIGPGARARVRPASPGPRERTIYKELAELLLDSLRRLDEGGVTPAPPPLSARRIEAALLPPAELAARVKHLSAEAKRLLLERSYRDAVEVLQRLADLDPGSPLVRANLEQLRRLGYTS
ncbi:MAG TPA: hypothetical protein VFS43_47605 [Polyangiaceae bacterium]|nr:hypothetical protein [Polyangiaceae bacterium]